MKKDAVLFNAWYDVEDNAFEDPLKVVNAECEHCCHGAQDYLKEAAFHASLVEAGK